MLTEQPLVSIIIPTYNRAHLIGETLDSVLAQTYTNWECIVVDDGSTDKTDAKVHYYVNQDSCFKYVLRPERKPKGANACRNYGLEICNGDLIMFLDSDDILFLDCLERRINFYFASGAYDFYIFQSLLFNYKPGDSNHIPNILEKEDCDLARFISFDYPWNTSSALLNVHYLMQNNLTFDEQLDHHQDLDFFVQLLCNFPNYVKSHNRPDVYIRMASPDKESKKTHKDSHLKAKIKFVNNLLNHIKVLPCNQTELKRRILGLSLSYGILFWSLRRYKLLLKNLLVFVKNAYFTYFIIYLPLLILVLFNKKYKVVGKKTKYKKLKSFMSYYSFDNSTLGKLSFDSINLIK
ncbi:glycosyltransferase family 2 protein [Paucihalobacter sp.]|uniref:glycosyltransferase family 2 protein n=1 Tax=Paucihalobacter sp. TaxID=2850405 RepID=UPI002FE04E3A